MKKLLGGILITAAIVGLVALLRFQPKTKAAGLSVINQTQSAPGPGSSRVRYKDGNYSGQTVDVGYGPVQVQTVIRGRKIIDIKFLQMPNDRTHSVEVTNMAEPILRSETLTAQSANIDIASGATQTSEGYIQSLQDALSQAKT